MGETGGSEHINSDKCRLDNSIDFYSGVLLTCVAKVSIARHQSIPRDRAISHNPELALHDFVSWPFNSLTKPWNPILSPLVKQFSR